MVGKQLLPALAETFYSGKEPDKHPSKEGQIVGWRCRNRQVSNSAKSELAPQTNFRGKT
jgi:hypothetical protein